MSGPKPGEIRSGLGVSRGLAQEIVPTAAQSGNSFRSQDRQNGGYSGTPMWKLALMKEQEVAQAGGPVLKLPDGFKPLEKGTALAIHLPAGRWYYNEKKQVWWDANIEKFFVWDPTSNKHKELYEAQTEELKIAVGSCFHEKASQVKHVLVNDLVKASQALRMSIDHLDRPCALYALYEGHRGSSGNLCADFCGKHLHTKLLPKLAAYRGYWEDSRLEAAMCETFQELDNEFAEKHPSSNDGCCAAVALILGKRLVIASLGDVAQVVCMKSGEAIEQLKAHAVKDPDEDDSDDDDDDDAATASNAPAPESDSGTAPPIKWTRAFGDLEFKRPTSSHRLLSTPDCKVIALDHTHRGFAFICRALYNCIGKSVAVSTVFRRSAGRARMASGALVDAAVQWLGGQVGDLGLGSIVVFFDKLEGADAPPGKKARVDKAPPSQVRLRHILLKHKDCRSTVDKVRNKQIKRTRGEAERSLRAVLEECEIDPKKTAFSQRCRDLSECQTSLKTGDLTGDLGWVKPGKHGQAFDAAAFALKVGQLSDLVDSDQGIHIIMRAA